MPHSTNVHFLKQPKPPPEASHDPALEATLQRLLDSVRRGEVISVLYVAECSDKSAEHGLAGSYEGEPSAAYYPMCAALADLGGRIKEQELFPARRQSKV